MTNEEFDKLCEELRAQGMSDEDILGIILEMFKDEKIDAEELEKLAGALGYEVTEEFKSKLAGPAMPGVETPEGEEITEEDIEDAQEVEPGEGEESDEEVVEEDEEAEEDEEEPEEDEKEEARKLFNL